VQAAGSTCVMLRSAAHLQCAAALPWQHDSVGGQVLPPLNLGAGSSVQAWLGEWGGRRVKTWWGVWAGGPSGVGQQGGVTGWVEQGASACPGLGLLPLLLLRCYSMCGNEMRAQQWLECWPSAALRHARHAAAAGSSLRPVREHP